MNRLKKNDSKAMKDYHKLKKYWRMILKKETKSNYTSLRQFSLFQWKYVTESDV